MKKILLSIIALFIFAGCSKLEIDYSNVIGEWVTDYSDFPNYMPEGFVTYTFNADKTVDIHVYDVFAGESDYLNNYCIEDGVLLLNPHMSDFSGDNFIITKLTNKEMSWQRQGTQFTEGTVGSDYIHLKRK